MIVPKQYGRFCKDQTSMAEFVSFKHSFSSRNHDTSKFPELFNPDPSLAICQTPKYSKNDLPRILKTILGAQLTPAYGQDCETSEDSLEQIFKPRAPNVYKGRLYIDHYNFI